MQPTFAVKIISTTAISREVRHNERLDPLIKVSKSAETIGS